jgi:hypothetical protein
VEGVGERADDFLVDPLAVAVAAETLDTETVGVGVGVCSGVELTKVS